MTGRITGLLILAFMALAETAHGFSWPWQGTTPTDKAAPPPVASIILVDSSQNVRSVPGAIASRVEVTLGFQTIGRVAARNVDTGDLVKAGQILASLNPDDLQGDVNAARAAVKAAEVQLQTTEAMLDRTRELTRRNVAPAAQLEQAERAFTATRAQMDQAQSQLARALDAEGFAVMTAPFDGVISASYVNTGAVVSAGEPVFKLAAQDELEAVIDLPETALQGISIGDAFEVWAESDPDHIQIAKVRQIAPLADAATRTRRVHLALAEQAMIRLGTLIRARPQVNGDSHPALPEAAILTRDGTPGVWVVQRQGNTATVSRREITPAGPAINGIVAISDGLSLGEEIVIRGIHSLTEGQAVGESVAP